MLLPKAKADFISEICCKDTAKIVPFKGHDCHRTSLGHFFSHFFYIIAILVEIFVLCACFFPASFR